MESSRDAYYADENAARQRMERQPPAHFSSSISASQPSDYSDRYHPMSADSTQAEVRSSVTPSRYSMAQAVRYAPAPSASLATVSLAKLIWHL